MNIELTKNESKIYNLLNSTKKRFYTYIEISSMCYVSDVRTTMTRLRRKVPDVCEEWRITQDGTRYKVFYIKGL